MSAFYDLASLVLVPSGYKSGKVYAQKPLTTDGQLTFTRASTATRVNASGVIETVSSGVPRLDYLGSTCPKLLLEPSRTNLALRSSEFDNAAWTKNGATISANAIISPDGYTNADKIVESATNSSHDAFQTFSSLSSSIYTASVFVKKGERFKTALADRNTGAFVAFNLNTGTIISSNTFTGKIEAYGNDWYRISVTSATALTIFVPQVFILEDSYTTGFPILLPYTGDGTSGLYVWGGQVEAGAYPTSLIPTTTAAVTRVADACSKTGISSLIGQTQGTIFFEVDKTLRIDNDYRVQISDGTTSNWLFISLEVGNNIRLYCNTGGVNQFSVYGSAVTSGRHKIAMAYKANDFKVYVDGVAWITQTSGSVPACSKFNLGSSSPTVDAANTDSKTSQALLFKTRLTNAQLAELTAL